MSNKIDLLGLVFKNYKFPERYSLITKSSKNTVLLDVSQRLEKTIKKKFILQQKESVKCLVLLPCGKKIAAGSQDTNIYIWNMNNHQCESTLYGHTASVKSLLLFPNGNLASGADDNTIRIWDSDDEYKCIHVLVGHEDLISCLVLLPNGNLLSGSWDSYIKVWDRQDDFKCIRSVLIDTGLWAKYLFHLLLLKDGNLATAANDYVVNIYDHEYEIIQILKTSESPVLYLHQLGNGNLISLSGYREIKEWDYLDGKCLRFYFVQYGFTTVLSLSDSILVLTSQYGEVELLDMNKESDYTESIQSSGNCINSLLVLPNSDFVTGSHDGKISCCGLLKD
jgi:WD40 repeat protein